MNKTYYDKNYYAWQKKAGVYGANQDSWIYKKEISKNDIVLDFGCGGGYLLSRLICEKRYGVDINPVARKEAEKNGLHVFSNLSKIPKHIKFSVIMSHHALEHVDNPFEVLKLLHSLLEKNGKIVCIVPLDDWRTQKKYIKTDVNQHLYTWTPLSLGNLFTKAGFNVSDVRIISFAWLPLSRFYYKYIPTPLYKILTFFWSSYTNNRLLRIKAAK